MENNNKYRGNALMNIWQMGKLRGKVCTNTVPLTLNYARIHSNAFTCCSKFHSYKSFTCLQYMNLAKHTA